MKKRCLVISVLLVAFMSFGLSLDVQAGGYPVRAVKGIVPYGAGGATDVCFRAIVSDAEKYLGKPIAIVNKKGASGSVGGNYVAKAKPDGYTILLAPNGVVTIYPNMASDPAYSLGDLIPVVMIVKDALMYVSRSDAPWNSVKGLIEAARKSPGDIRFGTPGPGTMGAFGMYTLQMGYPGLKFATVPMGGHSDTVAAMLRGEVDVCTGVTAGFKAQFDAGTLKPIGFSSDRRSPFYPNVPTCWEQGVKIMPIASSRYVWVPRGTPIDVRNKIEKAFMAMCKSPTVAKRIKDSNLTMDLRGQGDAMKNAISEYCKFKQVIDHFGIKIKKK